MNSWSTRLGPQPYASYTIIVAINPTESSLHIRATSLPPLTINWPSWFGISHHYPADWPSLSITNRPECFIRPSCSWVDPDGSLSLSLLHFPWLSACKLVITFFVLIAAVVWPFFVERIMMFPAALQSCHGFGCLTHFPSDYEFYMENCSSLVLPPSSVANQNQNHSLHVAKDPRWVKSSWCHSILRQPCPPESYKAQRKNHGFGSCPVAQGSFHFVFACDQLVAACHMIWCHDLWW